MIQVKEHQRVRFGRTELVSQHERSGSNRFSHSPPKGNETPNRTPEQHARMLERFSR
jgi:hypothetical protein